MDNIKSTLVSKGNPITRQEIESMFTTHARLMERINYLVDSHRCIDTGISSSYEINRIELGDNVLDVLLRDEFLSGGPIRLSFDLSLFEHDDTIDQYVESIKREANEEKERKAKKRAEKIAKRQAKIQAKKLEKAKKLLTKHGYAVVEGAPIVDLDSDTAAEPAYQKILSEKASQ